MRTTVEKAAIAVALFAVVVVTASPVAAGLAQMKDPAGPTPQAQAGPQMQQPGPAAPNRISGRVQSVTGERVTLADGTQLLVPTGIPMHGDQLKPGATIKASYAETAGLKVATSIEVERAQ